MREVIEMDVQVFGWGTATGVVVECTECGPLGVCGHDEIVAVAQGHITNVHPETLVTA